MEKCEPRPGEAVPRGILGKKGTAEPDGRWCCVMTRTPQEAYQMLIDMQCEKIRHLEQEKDRQRKEINRLKRQIKAMEKVTNAKVD